MLNNGKGGMRTSDLQYSIICPICGKPAARFETYEGKDRYLHFTRKGGFWHTIPHKYNVGEIEEK